MVSANEAFLLLLEVDQELAEDLGEEPLAREIVERTPQRTRQIRSRAGNVLRPYDGDRVWAAASRSANPKTRTIISVQQPIADLTRSHLEASALRYDAVADVEISALEDHSTRPNSLA